MILVKYFKSIRTGYIDLYGNCLKGIGERGSFGYHVTVVCVILVVKQAYWSYNMMSSIFQGEVVVKYHSEVNFDFFCPQNSVNLKQEQRTQGEVSIKCFKLNW